MNFVTIIESGISFGPYSKDDCFYIEHSAAYEKIKGGIKMAEFLWIVKRRRKAKIYVVEAKSSSPRPENKENFQEFVSEIREKLVNALVLFLGLRLGRHEGAGDEIPENLRDADLATIGFTFVLVVRNHREEWLVPLQDALNVQLNSTARTFGLQSPYVAALNEEMAGSLGLIRREVTVAP